MPSKRLELLRARIRTIDRDAAALEGAFRSEALRTDVRVVIARLREAQALLRGDADAALLDRVDAELDAIAARLAGIGRAG